MLSSCSEADQSHKTNYQNKKKKLLINSPVGRSNKRKICKELPWKSNFRLKTGFCS